MALREDQIHRYSRQILLREVGGRGQERLLGAGVHADVGGAAGLTAAAYLAAAGSPLVVSERPLAPGAAGFLTPSEAGGAQAGAALARELPAVNPDALASAPTAVQLAELPAPFAGSAPWVALGAREGQGAVVFRAASACARCFEVTAATLGPPPDGALGTALGALGALVLQRLVLGQGPAAGLLLLAPPGALTSAPTLRCADCA